MNERIPCYLGLSPSSSILKDDFFIVGYPKSGNTWFQNIIAGIVYGINPELVPDSLTQEIIPDLHRKKFFKRIQTPMFFKTHNLPRCEYRKVIYLLRDGRDVMVSYYHYNTAIYGKSVSMNSMIVKMENIFPCQWHEHVEKWSKNPFGAQIILVKYEELLNKPLETLLKVSLFIGVERDEAQLMRVYEQCSFNKLQKREIKTGLDDSSWPNDKLFFRRGKVGSHLDDDEMSPENLQKFMHIAENTLRKNGYLS